MEFVLETRIEALVFWLCAAAWLLEPLLLVSFETPRATGDGSQGRRELWLVMAGILAAFVAASTLHRLGVGNLSGPAARCLRWLGLLSLLAGVALRYWSALTLGEFFTRGLEVRADHVLISHGPYRWLRHPLYTGLLLATSGLALLFANLLALAVAIAIVTASLEPRVRREERLLEARFGVRYRDWKALRYRLVPPLF